jgi:apolipoprotein N-acyltransferase
MNIKSNSLFANLVCLLAGALLILAFAPFGWFFIAPLALAVLFFFWLDVSPKQAFMRGFMFGFGMFGFGVSWVYISIHRFGNANVALAALITILFVIVLALFPAIQGYLTTKFLPKKHFMKLLMIFPVGWVLFEWIRDWLFTGFPWLFLGYSQTNSPLRGYAPILGCYGVSFLVVFSTGLLVIIVKFVIPAKAGIAQKLIPVCAGITLIIIWLAGGMLAQIQWTKPIGKPIKVSLIQGNIPQQLKWNPDEIWPTIKRYQQLTTQSLTSDLIIWPEAAIPMALTYPDDYLTSLAQMAKQHNTSIILGVPLQDNGKYYNAAIALGNGQGIYYKRHLVPFGEYLPLEAITDKILNLFNIPISDLHPGPQKQNLLKVNNIYIAPFVCYEMAYSALVRSDLPKAQILITISNDAWFGKSIASAQHLQIGQMRALESGRYMLFSTNNGITAIINPNGKIIKSLPRDKTAVLTGMVQPMSGRTPYL